MHLTGIGPLKKLRENFDFIFTHIFIISSAVSFCRFIFHLVYLLLACTLPFPLFNNTDLMFDGDTFSQLSHIWKWLYFSLIFELYFLWKREFRIDLYFIGHQRYSSLVFWLLLLQVRASSHIYIYSFVCYLTLYVCLFSSFCFSTVWQ